MAMIERQPTRLLHVLSLCATLGLPTGCARGAVKPGNAVGKIGSGLAVHANAVPQGGEACMMNEALEPAAPGTAAAAISDPCQNAFTSDQLWRRSMLVLAAYAARLDGLASGVDEERAGKLEAIMTGVEGESWVGAETPDEKAARTAAGKLVEQIAAADAETDLDKTVSDASGYVTTLCTGLERRLGETAAAFAEVRNAFADAREKRTDRRCGTLDKRSVCVSESMTDRLVHSSLFGDLSLGEARHLAARDDVATFCAAHAKLAEAVANGNADKDETYTQVIEAARGVSREKPAPNEEATAEGESTESE